jgi:hypothetical protein
VARGAFERPQSPMKLNSRCGQVPAFRELSCRAVGYRFVPGGLD